MLCSCAFGLTPRLRDAALPQVRGLGTRLHLADPKQQFDSSLPRIITQAARGRGDGGGLGQDMARCSVLVTSTSRWSWRDLDFSSASTTY